MLYRKRNEIQNYLYIKHICIKKRTNKKQQQKNNLFLGKLSKLQNFEHYEISV